MHERQQCGAYKKGKTATDAFTSESAVTLVTLNF